MISKGIATRSCTNDTRDTFSDLLMINTIELTPAVRAATAKILHANCDNAVTGFIKTRSKSINRMLANLVAVCFADRDQGVRRRSLA